MQDGSNATCTKIVKSLVAVLKECWKLSSVRSLTPKYAMSQRMVKRIVSD